jgi:SAM-dependent methyltransferase
VTTTTKYDRPFYEGIGPGSEASARRILPVVLELVDARSAVDVGCGDGSWLQVLRELGADDVVGVDGPWALGRLKIDRTSFVPVDLSSPLGLRRRFDLALSLEVAEHLPAPVAPRFVQQLTELAPVVLFSAAVPGQGGTGHVNEQWPDFWAQCFADHGYRLVDALRGRFWDDPTIEPWYAQNAFLFANEEACAASPALAAAADEGPHLPLRVVHPGTLARRESSVNLGEVLRVLPKAAGSSLRHHAARLRAR